MRYETLLEVYRRVEAPRAVTAKLLPLEQAFVFCTPAPPTVVDTFPVTVELGLYNCGGQACRIIDVHTDASGTQISPSSDVVLAANGAYWNAFKVEVQLSPFDRLPADCTAPVVIRWEDVSEGESYRPPQTLETSLSWMRESTGAEIAFESAEARFETLWVDGLRLFSLAAGKAKAASLSIETGEHKGTYAMRRDRERFVTAIPIAPAGEAHYRFRVDGLYQHDKSVPETVPVPGADTPCTPLYGAGPPVARVRVRNTSRFAARVTFEVNEPWLECGVQKVRLAPAQVEEIVLKLRPDLLPAGEFVSELKVIASTSLQSVEKRLPVVAVVRAAGPICRHEAMYDLGLVFFYTEKTKEITVSNFGDEVLEIEGAAEDGYISVARERIEPGRAAKLTLRFDFGRIEPASGTHTITLILKTNSFSDAHRSLSIDIVHELVVLRIDPPSIDFGILSTTQMRSYYASGFAGPDFTPVLHLVPVEVPPWIVWHQAENSATGTISIDGDHLARSEPRYSFTETTHAVRGQVIFRDGATGMCGMLAVTGVFAHPRASRKQLRFGWVREPKFLPLPIENTGAGDLIIQKVVLDVPWLQVKRPAQEGGPLVIVALPRPGLRGEQRATIMVHTSDPRASVVTVPVTARMGG